MLSFSTSQTESQVLKQQLTQVYGENIGRYNTERLIQRLSSKAESSRAAETKVAARARRMSEKIRSELADAVPNPAKLAVVSDEILAVLGQAGSAIDGVGR